MAHVGRQYAKAQKHGILVGNSRGQSDSARYRDVHSGHHQPHIDNVALAQELFHSVKVRV